MKNTSPVHTTNEARLVELYDLLFDKVGSMDLEVAQKYVDEMCDLSSRYERKDMLAWSNLFQSHIYRLKGNKDLCISILEQAIADVQEIKNPELNINLYKYLGFAYSLFNSDYKHAHSLYKQALKITQEHQLKQYEARIYDNIGVAYQAQSKHYLANQTFQKAIKIYREIGEEHRIGNVLHNMAIWYSDKEKAIELLKEAARIHIKYKDKQRLFLNYHILATHCQKLDKIENALEYTLKSIGIVDELQSPVYQILAYYTTGELMLLKAISNPKKNDLKLLEKAQEWSEKMQPMAAELNITDFKARAFSLKGRIAYHQGNVDEGLSDLIRANDIAEASESYIDMGIKLEILRCIHAVFAEKKNYESAYKYHCKFHDLKQEITTAEAQKDVQELQTQYETEQKEAEVSRLQELEVLKTRFFSQITHELRTPLTLIQGPTRQILNHSTESTVQMNANIIECNASRLLQLVNQLLDIGKLEAGKMSLKKRFGQLSVFIESIIYAFQGLATQEQIQLDFINEMEELVVNFDASAVEKILYNLLSNAFKFTPEQGRIMCYLSTQNTDNDLFKNIKIIVSDTGKGMSEENLPHIFDRFYQVDGSYTRQQEGTGIGLSLVKELIDLMEGTIEVSSKVDEGTEFTINFPVEITDKPTEIIATQAIKLQQNILKSPEKQQKKAITKDEDAPVLLLIEDNRDIHEYIRSIFENDYVVLQSYNGNEGIEMARERIPDIIISDVMMPEKDGYEVCHELKNDMLTSHIPIILLTAKTALDSRIEGFRRKADAYLSKPFNELELVERVKGLIAIRRELQKKYTIGTPSESPENQDSVFLRRVNDVIIAQLDNTEFGATQLTEALFLSRSQLFRKLKALTGKSTSAFIRSVRLLKGLELLKTTSFSITQIAFEVGFANPSYFTTKFSEEFGYSPSEVRN